MSARGSLDILADPVDKIACRKCGKHLDVSAISAFTVIKCPACSTTQTVPARFGSFLLLEQLGTGGMGAVYEAVDTVLGRHVAIKVMKQALGDDPQFVDNFLREARSAAAINHRNIVQIYSCGQEKGQPYIVMELISGGRLDQMMASGTMLDETRILEIAINAAEGLKAASDINLVHGDIKPQNILFDKEGTAKVADFGLAKFVQRREAMGEIWGTPYYIAPEKARKQKEDFRSDIYSLGATLFHALTQKPPFDGDSATQVVVARLQEAAPSITTLRSDLHPRTAAVIARMLDADPTLRYPTYASLISDLREALAEAKREGPATVRGLPVAKAPAKYRGLMVALLVVVLAGVIGGVVYWIKHKKAVHEKVKPPPANVVKPPPETPAGDALHPFIGPQDTALVQAMAPLDRGDVKAVLVGLEKLVEGSGYDSPQRYWLRLYEALVFRAAGRDVDAEPLLAAIVKVKTEAADPKKPSSGMLQQQLALFITGSLSETNLLAEAVTNGPGWYERLAKFVVGLEGMKKSQPEKAAGFFAGYRAAPSGDPAWPYAFTNLADHWVQQGNRWKDIRKTTADLTKAKKYAEAVKVLEAFYEQASPMIHPLVGAELTKARKAEQGAGNSRAKAEAEAKRKQQEAKQQEANQAQQQKIVAEKEKINAARKERQADLKLYQFVQASVELEKIRDNVSTPEARQYLDKLEEFYQRLNSLVDVIVRQLNAGAGRTFILQELGGDGHIISATRKELTLSMGTAGTFARNWSELSPRLFSRLVKAVVAARTITPQDRARHLGALAFYCYELGEPKAAEAFAEQADKVVAGTRAELEELIPDLSSAPK